MFPCSLVPSSPSGSGTNRKRKTLFTHPRHRHKAPISWQGLPDFVRSWAEQEERASGRMKAFAGIALAAPARVPGVMGALPWDPSRLSPSTGRYGPGEMEEDKLCQHRPRPWAAATMDKDMGSVASVDQHELISFLDDTDTDADEFILCSSNNSSPSSHNQQQQQQSQQQHKQSPSSSSYHNLYLRPDSSRSHQHFHFPRTSSESGSRSGTGSTATATANSTTWTLRSGKSHEKSNSSGSKKTTATTVSAANSATMAVKPTKVNTTGSATITVPPPPVSPSSSGPFGAQMTKQEFEALPEAIQRKLAGKVQADPGQSYSSPPMSLRPKSRVPSPRQPQPPEFRRIAAAGTRGWGAVQVPIDAGWLAESLPNCSIGAAERIHLQRVRLPTAEESVLPFRT
ncbi:uncharacterized protein CLUP02_05911 [Colletotrichum lupini]|uniref:Uncharacterized protein n=1 Tax=Colletotrichum lupini TaxID=145971 RepID=A0A9Q8SND0_9PEZI|nr:uncharacterized protein CLUP02_05911 [Colletotrichum lupini]UQC80428.1 hypothetical protein CLUP02_05911 [Colletotrichum lupini]